MSEPRIEAQRCLVAEKVEFERRAAQELEIEHAGAGAAFSETLPTDQGRSNTRGRLHPGSQGGGDYYDFSIWGQDRFGLGDRRYFRERQCRMRADGEVAGESEEPVGDCVR